jgi:parvulin-like peptidyl-prolyl isomerase
MRMMPTATFVFVASMALGAMAAPAVAHPGPAPRLCSGPSEGPGLQEQQAAPPVQEAAKPAETPKPAEPAEPAKPRTEMLEQILVKVNGEIFTKTDLETRQVQLLRQRAASQKMTDEELATAIAEVTPNILVDAVDELLLLQRGRELNYKVSDEQFARVLENIRKENKLEDDKQFEAALKQEGIDVSQLRRNIERSMVINQVQQVEVMGRIGVTETEAVAYYESHKNEFSTPTTMTLRELSVGVKTDGVTLPTVQDENAKRKAESALARAKAGESFETLVAELSDSASKASGGLVGPINESDLDPAIQKLLQPLKAGQTTDVFRTRAGWAILKVETLNPAKTKTLEEARDEISEKVFQQKRRAELVKYLQKLRGQAILDWRNAEMKKLFDGEVAAEAAKLAKQG